MNALSNPRTDTPATWYDRLDAMKFATPADFANVVKQVRDEAKHEPFGKAVVKACTHAIVALADDIDPAEVLHFDLVEPLREFNAMEAGQDATRRWDATHRGFTPDSVFQDAYETHLARPTVVGGMG